MTAPHTPTPTQARFGGHSYRSRDSRSSADAGVEVPSAHLSANSPTQARSSLAPARPGPDAHVPPVRRRTGVSDAERTRDCAHLPVALPTAAVANDAPVSAAAGFSEELTIEKAKRLALLTDAHRARKRHASTKVLMAQLRRVTARLAEMEAVCPQRTHTAR